MLIDIDKHYIITETNDTCIVLCFFSPLGYQKPIQNIKYNIARLKKAKIPYVLVELLYPNQYQKIAESIVVKSNSIIFSKENLWNIACQYIPEKYSKIIFLDSDIVFNLKNWFDLASDLLNNNNIIQPFEYAYRDVSINILEQNNSINFDANNHEICKNPIIKAIINNETISLAIYEPGFSIGMTRDFFHKINGFFEYAITGSNDSMFWLSFKEFANISTENLIQKMPILKEYHEPYKKRIQQNLDKSRMNYLQNCIGLHLYHGTKDNRFYQTRNKYLPKDIEFYYNDCGVLEIKSSEQKDLKQYWIDRKEDE